MSPTTTGIAASSAFVRSYDAAGEDDPNAPWVQISRAVYVAEVGTRLRSAAGFGVLALALVSVLSVAEEGMSLSRRSRRGELRLADDLSQPGWPQGLSESADSRRQQPTANDA
jgi:hypothetical protein